MNTTNFIQNLFNSANPMTTENSYEPSGVCIGDTVLDNTPSGFALFQAIGGHYTSPAQAIEELVDNAVSSIRANGGSGEVILRLTDIFEDFIPNILRLRLSFAQNSYGFVHICG